MKLLNSEESTLWRDRNYEQWLRAAGWFLVRTLEHDPPKSPLKSAERSIELHPPRDLLPPEEPESESDFESEDERPMLNFEPVAPLPEPEMRNVERQQK